MIGRQISHYRILEKIGGGGMGVVYKAEDTRLGRPVALKFLPAEVARDSSTLERFQREARAASALNHPHICTIHDLDEDQGRPFIAMEFLEGKALNRRLQQGPLAADRIVEIGMQVADALAAAHGRGIVHRDIKAANIWITDRGDSKVLDFGLAKLTGTPAPAESSAPTTIDDRHLTSPGEAMGTVAYMSPEQALGKDLDARTDLFSLGVVLYEMAAGAPPFKGTTSAAIFDAILHKTPPSILRVNPELPEGLERIIRRTLEKDRDLRYQSAADLLADLRRLKRELDSGASPAQALPKPAPRKALRIAAVLAGLLAGVILAVAAGWLWFRRPPGREGPVVARPIPLTSFPGEEYSPSFSPDGGRIAFSWNGEKEDNFDIYVQQIGVGSPLRLTTDPEADRSPAWSPDGDYIAFLRQSGPRRAEVRLVPSLGGVERKIAETVSPGRPAWTPDGKWLAVTSRVTPEQAAGIYLISPDSGEKQTLTIPPRGSSDLSLAFSPDGTRMVFTRQTNFYMSHLYLLGLTQDLEPAGEPKQLTNETDMCFDPVWEPEGNRIIFSLGSMTTRDLYQIFLSGGRPRRLAFTGGNGWQPAVSAQGNRLAYAQVTGDADIYRAAIPEGGTAAGEAGEAEKFIFSTRWDSSPAYSPDGTRIAFVSERTGHDEIWLCAADGSNALQLTRLQGPTVANPDWSPDGRRICFTGWGEGNSDLYVISTEGGAPLALTSTPEAESNPHWSRDGRWIYFHTAGGEGSRIWKVDPEGKNLTPVNESMGRFPVESLDGKDLYFIRPTSGGPSLWKIPVGGGQESVVLENFGTFGYAIEKGGVFFVSRGDGMEQWIQFVDFASGARTLIRPVTDPVGPMSVSPDGRWILFGQRRMIGSDLVLIEDFNSLRPRLRPGG